MTALMYKNLSPKKCCHNQYFFYLPVVQGTTLCGQVKMVIDRFAIY